MLFVLFMNNMIHAHNYHSGMDHGRPELEYGYWVMGLRNWEMERVRDLEARTELLVMMH